MYSWCLRFGLRSVLGVLIGSVLFVSAGNAALTRAQLQNDEQQFLANPGQFLAQHPNMNRRDLAAVIKALAANPANLQTIIAALANASSGQQIAIGVGLGDAAAAVQQSDPSYANQIQTAVAASGSTDASSGYSSATGGTQIGSTGGGGGGGGGPTGNGPPSGGGGGGGGSSGGGSSTSGNTSGNLLTGGSVGSSGGLSGSVSP